MPPLWTPAAKTLPYARSEWTSSPQTRKGTRFCRDKIVISVQKIPEKKLATQGRLKVLCFKCWLISLISLISSINYGPQYTSQYTFKMHKNHFCSATPTLRLQQVLGSGGGGGTPLVTNPDQVGTWLLVLLASGSLKVSPEVHVAVAGGGGSGSGTCPWMSTGAHVAVARGSSL